MVYVELCRRPAFFVEGGGRARLERSVLDKLTLHFSPYFSPFPSPNSSGWLVSIISHFFSSPFHFNPLALSLDIDFAVGNPEEN